MYHFSLTITSETSNIVKVENLIEYTAISSLPKLSRYILVVSVLA